MIRDRGLRHWVPTYLCESLERARLRGLRQRQLTHLLLLICDHYEPRHGITHPDQPVTRVRSWRAGYQEMQQECFRRYGLRPVHTWFYPPHHGYEHLPALAQMVFEGLGEVELHYHHQNDSEATLRAALIGTLARYHRAGLLLQLGEPPGRRFGFIHGDWALDNSARGRYCGVNSELALLEELGCWADLTMPSANECQTRKINSIYYAVDDKARPKSHDWGQDARAGCSDHGGLLLIQGPLGINFRAKRHPRIENASLTQTNWGSVDRIRSWIQCHVHVLGRPQWLFIKLHAHGAIETNFDALFGEKALAMHAALAEQFNDGKRFQLHYVTARQAFNVVRAAEQGREGSPAEFLDHELPPQVTSLYCASAAHNLRCCTRECLSIEGLETPTVCNIHLRYPGISQVTGRVRNLKFTAAQLLLELALAEDSSPVSVRLAPGTTVRELSGCRIVGTGGDDEMSLLGRGPIRLALQHGSSPASAGAGR